MTSVDDILNGSDYFTCEHYHARMKKTACIERQAHFDHMKDRPGSLVADRQSIGCSGCAQGAQIREEMNMPSKKGVCAGCGKERTLLAHDKCFSCNGYGENKKKKAASGGGRNVEKKQKPAGVPAEMPPAKVKMVKEIKPKLPDPLPIAKIEGQAAMLLSPDPRIVLLDFTLPENADLYEPWVNFGRSHRRGPGDQAMMLIEELLTNEGLI